MMQRILVAYDGSKSSDKAFALGLDLAIKYSAQLHVLAVARPPEFGEEVETEASIEHSKRYYAHVLKPLRAKVMDADAKVDFEIAVGHPAGQIIYHAEQHQVDLIVMGHRGRTFIERFLLGSVAKHVIDHAPCAVLVAR